MPSRRWARVGLRGIGTGLLRLFTCVLSGARPRCSRVWRQCRWLAVTLAPLSPLNTEESVVGVRTRHCTRRAREVDPHGDLIRLGGAVRPRTSNSARVTANCGLQNLASRPQPIIMCRRSIQRPAHLTFSLHSDRHVGRVVLTRVSQMT